MLAFARRQDLRQEPVDIPAPVRGIAELMRRTLRPGVVAAIMAPHYTVRPATP